MKSQLPLLGCLIFFTSTSAVADEIIIYNTTERKLFGFFCYFKNNPLLDTLTQGLLASDLIEFEPHSHRFLSRPQRKYYWGGFYQRFLVVAETAEKAQALQRGTQTAMIPIGNTAGCHFFIDNPHGKLTGLNAVTWNMRMLQEALETAFCFALEEIKNEYDVHAYSELQATVRRGSGLCAQEKDYQVQRERWIQQNAPRVQDKNTLPRIALCTSGGGYRAMISTLGFMNGAEKIGILDASTYIAAVSGSTWAVAGFIESKLPIASYIQLCADNITHSFLRNHDNEQVAAALLKQFAFTQNISLIDFYGALLAQRILSPLGVLNPHEITLASQQEKIKNGSQLLPIYAAVTENTGAYEWVEFTPFEVYSSYLGGAVPSWAFGRKFFAGNSLDAAPAQSLGYCMGIWGSALSANLKDIIYRYTERLASGLLARLLRTMVDFVAPFSSGRISAACVHNWTHGLAGCPQKNKENITLLDGGFECNLPLIPLLHQERAVDIIIIFDATYKSDDGLELQRAAAYAQQHGMPFPPLTMSQIHEPCSVHADFNNPEIPAILYIPLRKHKDYNNGWDPYAHSFICTFNFKYTREQMLLLSGLTEHSIIASKSVIYDTLEKVMKRKASR